MYADDLAAMCNTLKDFETFVKSFEKVTQQYGLTMSVKKTCVMSAQQFEVDANGGISRDQRLDREMQSRLSKAATACDMLRGPMWYRKTVSIDAKIRIFRACVIPVLLYGSETWSLTKKMMLSYLPDERRPSNVVIRKRWEAKVMDDLTESHVRNCRRETRDRDKWRELVIRHVQSHPVQVNIQEIIHAYKVKTATRCENKS